MEEIIRSIANPNNSEFQTMLKILFDIRPSN